MSHRPRRYRRRLRLMLATCALLALPGASAVAANDKPSLEQLRQADVRLAAIGYRLATANASLCQDVVPVPGMSIHTIDQYAAEDQATAHAIFGFETSVAVEHVVPGSAADRAGVRANDSIVSVNGHAVPVATGAGHFETYDAFLTILRQQPANRALTLALLRTGQSQQIQVAASPGCSADFEFRIGNSRTASADGQRVEISTGFFEKNSDPELAVVVAHELSHNILRHRARLDAAKVSRGLLREVGRNGRLFRKTEDDADRLSVHLLRNAGWNPALAVSFWRGPGAQIDGGIFHSRTHSSSGKRANLIAQEIAALPPGAPVPYRPPILTTRDQPLQ